MQSIGMVAVLLSSAAYLVKPILLLEYRIGGLGKPTAAELSQRAHQSGATCGDIGLAYPG